MNNTSFEKCSNGWDLPQDTPKGTTVRTDWNSHLWEPSVGTADRVRLEDFQALRAPPRKQDLLSREKPSVSLSCSIWRCAQPRDL